MWIQEQLSEQLFNAGSVFTVRALSESFHRLPPSQLSTEPQRICRRAEQLKEPQGCKSTLSTFAFLIPTKFDTPLRLTSSSQGLQNHKIRILNGTTGANPTYQSSVVFKSKLEFSRALSEKGLKPKWVNRWAVFACGGRSMLVSLKLQNSNCGSAADPGPSRCNAHLNSFNACPFKFYIIWLNSHQVDLLHFLIHSPQCPHMPKILLPFCMDVYLCIWIGLQGFPEVFKMTDKTRLFQDRRIGKTFVDISKLDQDRFNRRLPHLPLQFLSRISTTAIKCSFRWGQLESQWRW